ncbi:MAG: PA0069 family radical SAM protein [Myxococcota bacterium]|nr:PA0069 family radical SAM protein [Myxococcota bacterium]
MERRNGTSLRGRGAVDNPAGRYESTRTVPFDDHWSLGEEEPRLPTIVQPEETRKILSSNTSPDVPFNRSVNPYKGCEHGCIYCFARPTHAYLGLSPGLDFETRIVSKPDAARLLRKELGRKNYQPETIALGANTDPYQPAEEELRITRSVLEVLEDFGHPVAIITKSARVLRDRDILARLAARNLVQVYLSITTLDPQLARRMEPRASSPQLRVRALHGLRDAGIPAGVLASPMIPALNDHELEGILEAASAAGADRAGYILLRLPGEVAELFESWLRHHYPDRANRVLEQIRACREGDLYEPEFGSRMTGTGPYAELLQRRFNLAVRRLGLDEERPPLSRRHFKVPEHKRPQLQLF